MKTRASLFISVSALALAFSAPAMAQSILNLQTATGYLAQDAFGNITSVATGLTALALGNQFSANSVNQIGSGTTALSVSPSFSFGQSIANSIPANQLYQDAWNEIIASSTSPLLANVTAGLSGGNQTASNAANSATFSLLPASTGTLQQSLVPGSGGGDGDSHQVASNVMSAVASAGNASILGNGFGQVAANSINSSAFLTAGAASLGLDQKSLGSIEIDNDNLASVNVTEGGNPIIDPLITGLSQSASLSMNSVSAFGGNALTLTTAGAGQGQALEFKTGALGSTVDTGNIMQAWTGTGVTAAPITGRGTGVTTPAVLGVGTSGVTDISQANRLTLNTVASSGATTFGDLAQPFSQTIDTAGLSVTGSGSGNLGGIGYVDSANLILAGTSAGAAAITGSGTVATQLNNVAMNSTSSGGLVNGTLNQTGRGSDSYLDVIGLDNTAIAVTASGSATIMSVSQGQNLSLNTMSGQGGTGLDLYQTATNSALGGNNVQKANTTIGIATIGGGLQQSTLSVNVAALGAFGSGNILQSATEIGQYMGNTLLASGGGAAQAVGSQSVTNTSNAIR